MTFTPQWPSYERARAFIKNSGYTLIRHTREWEVWHGRRGKVVLFRDGRVGHEARLLTMGVHEFGAWLNAEPK